MCLSRYTVTLTAVSTPIRYYADRCIQQHMPSRRPLPLRGDTVNCRGTPIAARHVFTLFCRCADRVQLHHYSLCRYADRSAYADTPIAVSTHYTNVVTPIAVSAPRCRYADRCVYAVTPLRHRLLCLSRCCGASVRTVWRAVCVCVCAYRCTSSVSVRLCECGNR